MLRRSEEEEIAEALADMPRWQRKTARSLLGYGILIAFLGMVTLAMPWVYWHKIVLYSSTKPLKAAELLLGPLALGVFIFVKILPMLVSSYFMMMRAANQRSLDSNTEIEEVTLR